MQRITMEDFGNIHCLSQLQYAPDGKAAAFVVTRADVKKNEYLSEIWLMEKQQDAFTAPRKLTAGGKESSFLWLDGQNLLLLAILVWLQYSLWFGKNGIHDYTRVNDDVAAQQATNAKLKARNDQLFAEIDDLNGGQEALEERARNELSMTRPGETFYRLVPDASKRAQSAGQNNR